jgi:hypothetical protein
MRHHVEAQQLATQALYQDMALSAVLRRIAATTAVKNHAITAHQHGIFFGVGVWYTTLPISCCRLYCRQPHSQLL